MRYGLVVPSSPAPDVLGWRGVLYSPPTALRLDMGLRDGLAQSLD
jgi:hypothetical protein